MYLKRLLIETSDKTIRDMRFKRGLNLIVDDTKDISAKTTGNNVGKTTVLELVDFCLGASPKIIYTDKENPKNVYEIVKRFLTDERVVITLLLGVDLDDEDENVVEIKRNFLSGKQAIRQINGRDILDKDFDDELAKSIFDGLTFSKPSFRQIISHNIRYKDDSIANTLKTLDRYTSDVEYETLYLYMFGCVDDDGAEKQALVSKLTQEQSYKERLEKDRKKTSYEMALGLLNDEIADLNARKNIYNFNEEYNKDFNELNSIKYKINRVSSEIAKMNIRRSLIEESIEEIQSKKSDINTQQLRALYNEALYNVEGIQKSFEELLAYHNKMLVEKVKFIAQDLPELDCKLEKAGNELKELLEREESLSKIVSKRNTFEVLEDIISELNDKYRLKGEYEGIIAQISEAEQNIRKLEDQLNEIDKNLYSSDFEERLKNKLKKFNKYFSTVSKELYDESYGLTCDKDVSKKTGRMVYKFSAFNSNMSSGKKQGEILCFDLAYLLFAETENIPSLRFLLNDKKELMHGHQLEKVAEYVKNQNMQLVISILKDKLPTKLLDDAHVVVELSQEEKLFKIENQN